MKKTIFLVGLLLAVLLSGCAGTEALYKDNEGNVKASRDFLTGIAGANPDRAFHYSPYDSSLWLKNGQLDRKVVRTMSDEDDEFSADGMADSNFHIFQPMQDRNRNITGWAWVADITPQPKLLRLRRNVPLASAVANENETTIAGKVPSGYRPIRYGVWFYYPDDSSHVKNKYDWPRIGKLSWQIDPRDQVIAVLQYSGKYPAGEIKHEVPPGQDWLEINRQDGDWLQFLVKTNGQVKYFDVKEDDNGKEDVINLKNLKIIPYYNGTGTDPKFFFQILDQLSSAAMEQPNITMPLNQQLSLFNKYRGKVRMVNWDNYQDGFIRFNCADLRNKATGDCDHNRFYNKLVELGAIGTETQGTVVVGKIWLRKNFPTLYEKYKDRVQFPEPSAPSVKPEPKNQPVPPGKQAPAKDSGDGNSV